MNETFKAGLSTKWTVTDDHIIIKSEEIPYNKIREFSKTIASSLLTNGVYKMVAKGKTYQLAYSNKDKERVEEAENFIKDKMQNTDQDELSLKTAEDMYIYAIENGFGTGFSRKTGIKHFGIIEKNLLKDEEPLMTFIGIHNYDSPGENNGYCAYALTNKRIVMGMKKMLSEGFQSIRIDSINDITFVSKLIYGVLTIDTRGEEFNVGLDKKSVARIKDEFFNQYYKIKESKEKPQQAVEHKSDVDDLRKFKELLDDGIITEEEFAAKKKQILGL